MVKFQYRKIVFYKIVLYAFCFTPISNVLAQSINPYVNKWEIKAGVAFNSFSVIDKNFSLLTYSGKGLGATALIAYQGKLIKQEIDFSYSTAILNTMYNNSSSQTYITALYTNLFLLTNPKLFNILAGPQVALIYADRNFTGFLNNNSSFDFVTSLNAAVEINFTLNKVGLTLKNKISSPLFAYVQQPAFGAETSFFKPNLQNDEELKNKKDLLGFNKFFRVINCFAIDKKIANKHKISLGYNLDFYKLNTNRTVQNLTNSLTLSYGYLL